MKHANPQNPPHQSLHPAPPHRPLTSPGPGPLSTRRRQLLALALASPGLAAAHGNSHAPAKPAAAPEQTAWGVAGDTRRDKPRTVSIRMTDAMRFSPAALQVKLGETLRFVVRNEGKMLHEFVIGTPEALEEHAALMLKFPDMEHDEPYMAHVPPGQAGEIVWTFNRPGRFRFACLIAGHYQAGMVGDITVAGPATPPQR